MVIVLFTDFGLAGPYVGQMKAVLWGLAPGQPIIDLVADAPVHAPKASSYLLSAYAGKVFPEGTIFLCVIDPGVGGERPPMAAKIDGRWFVGPGNGLFEILMRRAEACESYVLRPPEGAVSSSFHGRDIFAPVAGRLAAGLSPEAAGLVPAPVPRFPGWSDDLAEIIYVDHFGNLMTGVRAAGIPSNGALRLTGCRLTRARTFSDMPKGAAFWYENANGLAEIAVNCGRAESLFSCGVGQPVEILPG